MSRVFGPYPARCVRVVDGDTLLLDIDLGFDHLISAIGFAGETRLACRIFGINAPELRTDAGKAALAFAETTLIKPGDLCQVRSHGWDKYGGRFDGEVTLPDGTGFGATMVANGQAVVYYALSE
jgi:endonuclease YncB( thermonuclease family)